MWMLWNPTSLSILLNIAVSSTTAAAALPICAMNTPDSESPLYKDCTNCDLSYQAVMANLARRKKGWNNIRRNWTTVHAMHTTHRWIHVELRYKLVGWVTCVHDDHVEWIFVFRDVVAFNFRKPVNEPLEGILKIHTRSIIIKARTWSTTN